MIAAPDWRWDPDRLDDQSYLQEGDPSGMLPLVASSGAQIRIAYRAASEAGLDRLADDGRPRAVVVAGAGAAALAGDILAAVCGPGLPLPVVTVRSRRLPGWVGAADLVIVVSRSGRTADTLAVAADAVRRGCYLLVVGGEDTPLQEIAARVRAPFVPVSTPGPSRAALWEMVVPLLVAADALRLTRAGQQVFEAAARRLEDVAHRCRPSSESFINPGKLLALELAETVPLVWGTSPLTAAAARRFGCQLAENAGYPALWGEFPDVGHGQVMTLDGPFARRDVFADDPGRSLRLFMLRDLGESPEEAEWRETCLRLAEERDVPVSELTAEGDHPLERIAGLVGLLDYGSVYLALGYGVDPTPIPAIMELRARSTQ